MTGTFVALKVRLIKAAEGREIGQGTLEYVGMIALAALLVMAIVAGFSNGDSLKAKVEGAIDSITGIGG